MTTIGARVRSLREYKEWSQVDLAGESNLKRPHISLIENNERTPGADSLAKLAHALETTTDYLLGLSDDPNPRPVPNHPALRDPSFIDLANLWPHLSEHDRAYLLRLAKRFHEE